MQGKKVWELLV